MAAGAYYRYQGCYKERPFLTGLPTPGARVGSPYACFALAAAAGFTVFGMQNGGECWAAYSLATATSLGQGTCNVTCDSAPSLKCGGVNANSLYEVVTGEQACARVCNDQALEAYAGTAKLRCKSLIVVTAGP